MAYKILKPELGHKIFGVLFDMDGLVLDTEKLYSRFWREAANQLGFPMTHEQALGMRSIGKEDGQSYLESLFGPSIDHDEVRALRIRLMDAFVAEHGVEEKPGIHELLNYLHAHNLPSAITTSSPMNRVEAYLSQHGLYDQFDALCSGKNVPHGKPAPDIYLYGASEIHVAPELCLALEDSPAGLRAAYRAGCLPVIIPDQDEPSEETLSLCFARADSLNDLCELIELLNH